MMLSRKVHRASLIKATEWLGLCTFMVALAALTRAVWKVGSSVTHFTLPYASLAAIVTLLRSSLVLMNRLLSSRGTTDCTSVWLETIFVKCV